MKTLILYESKMGFTKKCADYLYNKISDSDIYDIENEKFNLNDYDKILIGAPIYKGKLEKITKKFVSNNKFLLLEKKLGVFCAGMNSKEFHTAVQDSLPPNVFYHAEIVHCGGVIDYKKLNIKEKLTLWRRLKIRKSEELEKLDSLDSLI